MATATKTRRRPRTRPPEDQPNGWSLLSSQGKVILYLSLCPDATMQKIAHALKRTERAIARTLRELRRGGVVQTRTVNRRKLFRVNMQASLMHPTIEGYTLDQVFGGLRRQVESSGLNVCEEGFGDDNKTAAASRREQRTQ